MVSLYAKGRLDNDMRGWLEPSNDPRWSYSTQTFNSAFNKYMQHSICNHDVQPLKESVIQVLFTSKGTDPCLCVIVAHYLERFCYSLRSSCHSWYVALTASFPSHYLSLLLSVCLCSIPHAIALSLMLYLVYKYPQNYQPFHTTSLESARCQWWDINPTVVAAANAIGIQLHPNAGNPGGYAPYSVHYASCVYCRHSESDEAGMYAYLWVYELAVITPVIMLRKINDFNHSKRVIQECLSVNASIHVGIRQPLII
jgi:hypothetical protein